MRTQPAAQAEFRVPKERTPVEVLGGDGAWRRWVLFLASQSSQHDGPERVSDLLENGPEFLAVVEPEGAGVALLGRASIAAVRVEPWAEAGSDTLGLPQFEHAIQVTLGNGEVLRGVLGFAARPDQSRVVDHLNGPQHFFALQEADSVALINKRHVVRVELQIE